MDIQIETFSRWLDVPSEVQSRGPVGGTNLGVNRWYMDEVNRCTERQRGPGISWSTPFKCQRDEEKLAGETEK